MSIYGEGNELAHFSIHASCPHCGYSIADLILSNFSFNSHHGACETCHGLGSFTTFLEKDIVNSELTLAEGALLPWQSHPYYSLLLETVCREEGIPMNRSFSLLSATEKKKVLYGVPGYFEIEYIGKNNDGKKHRSKYE